MRQARPNGALHEHQINAASSEMHHLGSELLNTRAPDPATHQA